MIETIILPIRILHTNHENKDIICADVLTYPNLEDSNLDDIDFDDYIWEERDFDAPLFSNRKPKELFLIKTDITKEEFIMKIYENENLLNKAKKIFDDFDIQMKEKLEEFSNSDIFFGDTPKKEDL